MDPKDADRLQILRRRAFFVSSALTALGCGTQPKPPDGAPPAEAPVPAVPDSAADAAAPANPADAGSTEAGAADAAPPEFAAPPGVSEVAGRHYAALAIAVQDVRKRIQALSDSLPDDCKVTDQACDLKWRELADGLVDIDRSIRRLPPRCGGSSAEAKAYFERRDAQRLDLERRVAALSRRIAALVSTTNERARWKAHQKDADDARPEPCLKFACDDW